MLKNHLKIAIRQLVKNKLLSSINILSLSIGLTGALICYLILQHQFNFDSFHSQSSSTYRIVQHTHMNSGTDYWSTTCYPLPAALREDFPAVQTTQTAGPFSRVFSTENAIGDIIRFEEDNVLFVDEHYLDFFDFKNYFPDHQGLWLEGNQETAFQHPESIILTEAVAERYFGKSTLGKESLLGKTMLLNNKDALTVTGILKNPPNNTNLHFDLLVPYDFFRKHNPYPSQNWAGNYSGTAFVALPDNIDVPAFETTLNEWKKNYLVPEDIDRIEYRLQALSDLHLNSDYAATPGSYTVSRQLLWGLAAMAAFLLLIGCINFINISTARMSKRAKEVSINKVLGGTKHQLQGQFLSETALLSSIALLLSLSATHAIVSVFNQSFSLAEISLTITPNTYLFGTALTTIVILIAGWYPSFVLSNLSPLKGLKNQQEQISLGGFGLRQLLIVLQFGIVFALFMGMLVLGKQMDLFMDQEMGFQNKNIVNINIPGSDNYEELESFKTKLLQHPNIEAVSFASGVPMTDMFAYGTDVRFPQESEDSRRSAEMKVVDLNYLDLYGLKMKAGRWLDASNIQDEFNGFVVNEALVKELGLDLENAVGQQIVINEGQAPIIGVVEDFHNNSLRDEITPCLMFYWYPSFFHEAGLQLSTLNEASQTLAFVKETWQTNFPKAIFDYQFMDQKLANYYQLESSIYQAFRIFSIIAILIGCIGLYGLMLFVVETRNKEIGIRKVLGASVTSVVSLLSKDFIKLVLIAFVMATPIAWYFMQKWLENFAYHIQIQWWIFVLAGFIAVLIAFLTVSVQSVRAALANPVESLRNE